MAISLPLLLSQPLLPHSLLLNPLPAYLFSHHSLPLPACRPSLQVRGPARTAKEARKQAQKYAAAKEARSMLGALGRAGRARCLQRRLLACLEKRGRQLVDAPCDSLSLSATPAAPHTLCPLQG